MVDGIAADRVSENVVAFMVDGHRTYRLNAAKPSWLRLAQILILLVPMLRAIVKALNTH
jgi:hypothetical protein